MIRLSKSRKLQLLAAVVWLALYPAVSKSTEYADLPISAHGVTNSRLTLIIEQEVLVPSLTEFEISDANFSQALPFRGSQQADDIAATLRTLPNASLGHAVPYYYVAINHALGRIFRNMALNPRPDDDDVSRGFGERANNRSEGFDNLRDLIRLPTLDGARLVVQIYSNRERFDQAAAQLSLHAAEAFWDPQTARIGIFVDTTLFRWLPYQASWADHPLWYKVGQVRDYVARRVLGIMTHELVHFVQHADGRSLHRSAFLSEASAVFLEENVKFREEINQLAGAHSARGLPLLPRPGSPCRSLMEGSPPFGMDGLRRMHNAIIRALPTGFDLERELVLDDGEFYMRSQQALRLSYDLSLAFVLFASARSRDEFRRQFGPLLQGDDQAAVAASLSGLNAEFRVWMEEYAQKWWASENVLVRYQRVSQLVSQCLGNRDYIMANSGTRTMAALRPGEITPLIFAGDTFWRVQVPFFAFDHYALARSRARVDGYGDEPRERVLSRLGDAYESLGDIRSAEQVFRAIDSIDVRSVRDSGMRILLYRSRLKGAFYRQLLDNGREPTQQAFLFLNLYVDMLQLNFHGLSACLEPLEQARIEIMRLAALANDVVSFDRELSEHYDAIRERLLEESRGGGYQEALDRRSARCGQTR